MSRFDMDGDWSDNPAAYLWWPTVKRAMKSKRGLKVLEELHAALLALPQKRLIEGYVCQDGEVCAMGAIARHRTLNGGLTLQKRGETVTVTTLEEMETQIGHIECEWDMMALGHQMGIAKLMAWGIAYENDEGAPSDVYTPETRYQIMLRWVEEAIRRARAHQEKRELEKARG